MGTIKKMTKSKLYFTIFSFFLLIHGQNILTASAEENHVLIGVKFTGEYPEKREDGSGAFRTHCVESHLKNDDPLMFYGEPGKAHLHGFFGNPSTNSYSTIESLSNVQTTSCDGINVNKSAYWVPALIDSFGNRIRYIDPLFYYKTGYHVPARDIIPPPNGLKIIAGNALSNYPQNEDIAKFRCASWKSSATWFDKGDPLDHINFIPNCPINDLLEIRIVFPQCWDGKTLNGGDFKSHMAYPIKAIPPNTGTGRCPKTHPFPIPEISYNFAIYVTDETGPSENWRFSSDGKNEDLGGVSIHADWINGWEPSIINFIVENCLRKAVDCSVGLLGKGYELSPIKLE